MMFGYYTALERTLFCGSASNAHHDLWQKNCAVHVRGMELLKPGAKCADVAAELNEMYREWDLLKYRSFGYGHSFGVLCHYYGREASMEPMIMIPEGDSGAGGYREHDILIITEDGAENITDFPFGTDEMIVGR
jgi:creatinase